MERGEREGGRGEGERVSEGGMDRGRTNSGYICNSGYSAVDHGFRVVCLQNI
jgi:hypothetical protein